MIGGACVLGLPLLAPALAGARVASGGASGATRTNRCTRSTASRPRRHRVLRVGTYNGKKGQCATIQEAINAASPGNWILVAPGDYKAVEHANGSQAPRATIVAGADIARHDARTCTSAA